MWYEFETPFSSSAFWTVLCLYEKLIKYTFLQQYFFDISRTCYENRDNIDKLDDFVHYNFVLKCSYSTLHLHYIFLFGVFDFFVVNILDFLNKMYFMILSIISSKYFFLFINSKFMVKASKKICQYALKIYFLLLLLY